MSGDTNRGRATGHFRTKKRGGAVAVRRFLRETRAGATGIAAAAVTMMSVLGTALIVDHVWLVNQRDLLKSAADAAVVAATLELQGLPGTMSDDDVDTRLQAVAERYVRFNLTENLAESAREKMTGTLAVSVDVDRTGGTVGVSAQADLGGTLLSRELLDYDGPEDGTRVDSGAAGSIGATEIVLAIDTTGSMNGDLEGRAGRKPSRLDIVKQAATTLVDILAAYEDSQIVIGIVPWDYRIRIDTPHRERWENRRWAVYPTERIYPHPTRGPPGRNRYLPERQSLPPQNRLPAACRQWKGCLDLRLEDGRPTFSSALPSADPFTMSFYSEQTSRPEEQYASYTCQDYGLGDAVGGEMPMCYDTDRVPDGADICTYFGTVGGGPLQWPPQAYCRTPGMMPLNSDLTAVRAAIRALTAEGPSTWSSSGIAWGMRLLDPQWRGVWSDPRHPVDYSADVRKVLVLLTDGEDNHLSDPDRARQRGCSMAKERGVVIFTIAAMHPDRIGSDLAGGLTNCSSQNDDPTGNYVFVNNATPQALRDAFSDIARQLIRLKRTH